MSFKPPFLCYPVEETEGYVIRIKPEEEGEECFDFALDFDNSTAFLKAALETLGAPETDEDDSDLIDLRDPMERRMAVIEQVNTYAESHGIAADQFYSMCSALVQFVEEGTIPKPTKLTRVK